MIVVRYREILQGSIVFRPQLCDIVNCSKGIAEKTFTTLSASLKAMQDLETWWILDVE